MKPKLKALVRLELSNLYGINRLRHQKDPKVRKRQIALTGVWALLLLMMAFYAGALVYGLCSLGMAKATLPYLAMITSLLILAFGLFKAGGVVFAKNGYDTLSALPVRPFAIVLSRFLSLYVEDCLFTLVIMLPGIAVYGYTQQPGVLFYLLAVVGSLFIPLLPLVITVALGAVVTALASRMRHKTSAQTLLSLLIVVAVVVLSIGSGQMAEGLTPEMLRDLASTVEVLIGQVYPPALWFAQGLGGNILMLLLFAAVSLAAITLLLWLISRYFHAICRRLYVSSARHNYRVGELTRQGLGTALYRRELKRYFASTIYVTNTILGPIMGVLMAVAVLVAGTESITSVLPIKVDIIALLPFVLGAIFTMMPTTATAVSMEGKQRWILQSLPVSNKVWLDSKLLVYLTLVAPTYGLAEILLLLAVKPALAELVWMLIIPAVLTLFAGVFALTIDLHCGDFNWEREEQPVKQSMSAFFGGFAGPVLSLLCGIGFVVLPAAYSHSGRAVLCVLLLLFTAWLYRHNTQGKAKNQL